MHSPSYFLDESGGQLVQPVLPLVTNPGMYPVQPMPGFVTVFAPFLLPGKLSLRPAKFAQSFAIELRRCNAGSVAHYRKIFQPEVNSHHPLRVGGEQGYVGHLELGGQADVPVKPLQGPGDAGTQVTLAVSLEGGPFDGAVYRLALANPDPTDTYQRTPSTVGH